MHAVLCTKIVLERVTGKQCKHQFHTESSQRSALLSVMMYLLSNNEDLDTCATGHSPDSILKNILNPAVNTLLKNYAACKNDRITREKLSGKQRKLHFTCARDRKAVRKVKWICLSWKHFNNL